MIPEALAAEIREAKQNARLKVVLWTAVATVVALLIAVLFYAVQAADAAKQAAGSAMRQSETNAQLIKAQAAGDARRGQILSEIKVSNHAEAIRFQALLDTIYGPGKVTLGSPATVPPIGSAGNDPSDYAPPPGARSHPVPKAKPSPKPRPTKPPQPLSPPAPSPLPVPIPVPLPDPCPIPLICNKKPIVTGSPRAR